MGGLRGRPLPRWPPSSAEASPPSSRPFFGHRLGARVEFSPLALAFSAGIVLAAVPVYLFRLDLRTASSDGRADKGPPARDAAPVFYIDAGPPVVTLSTFATLRCRDMRGRKVALEACDNLPPFEEGLAQAIRETMACHAAANRPSALRFVLDIDFETRRTRLSADEPSSLSSSEVHALVQCVQYAMPMPRWRTVHHEHVRYEISVRASYPFTSSIP